MDDKAGLTPCPVTVFTYKTRESNLVCFLLVLALEYPNLDISETTRDYWVITGNLLFYFPFHPIRLVGCCCFVLSCMSKTKKKLKQTKKLKLHVTR